MAKTKAERPLTTEIVGVETMIEFVVREGGVIVDRGSLKAPPLFSATAARRWLSRQERDLLSNVRQARRGAEH
jgi:hypothetical protein